MVILSAKTTAHCELENTNNKKVEFLSILNSEKNIRSLYTTY